MDCNEHLYYKVIVRALDDSLKVYNKMYHIDIDNSLSTEEKAVHRRLFDMYLSEAESAIQELVKKYNVIHPKKCPFETQYWDAGESYIDTGGKETKIVPFPPKGKIWYFQWLRQHKAMEENNETTERCNYESKNL